MIMNDSTENQLTSRRDMLKLAVATGAGIAFAATTGVAQVAVTEAPIPVTDMPPDQFKFSFASADPDVVTKGGTVTECDALKLPMLRHGGAAVYLVKIVPGALREPHWHPNCWEIDYVVSGTVEFTIVPPTGPANTFTLKAGDIAFVPQGYAHSFRNIGDVEAVIPIVFSDSMPSDIGLSTMYAEFPTGQFAQTFGVPESAMSAIPRPSGTLFITPEV